MQFLIFIFFYPILWCISILPFRILYFVSDLVYILVYKIIGYRKKTVRANIQLTFPHLSAKEQLLIEKKFYHHLCDLFLEMIKTLTISKSEIDKRFVFKNLELFDSIEKKGKSVAVMCAHYASYEWSISLNNKVNFKGYGIYKKIRNIYFDKLVKDIRSKFKAHLITTKETIPTIAQNSRNNVLAVYGFASDQSPKINAAFHWNYFMGSFVPVHTGAEMLSKKYDMTVVFMKNRKVKRGFYEASFEMISEDTKSVPNYGITDHFLRLVEQQIYENPEYYLWTHKRWKHRKEN